MSKRRVLSFKPQPRLERGGQDGQHETEKPDHLARLGDSVTSSTRTRFSVHTGRQAAVSHRIGEVLTQGFLPRDDGLVKAMKLNKGQPNPGSGVAAGLLGSSEWHVQSSAPRPP